MTASVTELFADKRVLVTGGTGSIGAVLVRRLLTGEKGLPREIVVFSRDEAKQHAMQRALEDRERASDDVMYQRRHHVRFQIGNIADYPAVCTAVRNSDVIFHAAAMKQVPTCEYFPSEAIKTNINGPENIVRAIREHGYGVQTVVGLSTDKACKPVNTYGMTKAISERLFIQANLDCPDTRFVIARYGNVIASRGSVIPLFHEQIRKGGPLTITVAEMTRFLMTMDEAIDTIFAAAAHANPGETYVPKIRAASIVDLAAVLIANRPIEMRIVGIRPGEKVHEILISTEETPRSVERRGFNVIMPILPQLRRELADAPLAGSEYSSRDTLLSRKEISAFLVEHHLQIDDSPIF